MNSEAIDDIRKILGYRHQNHLVELLKGSHSRIYQSSTYGNYPFSILSVFEIYSPLWAYDELKNISNEDKNKILSVVLEIYPPKPESIEINDVKFYLDMDIESNSTGKQSNGINTPSQQNQEIYDIFVSHSHEDYDQVKDFVDKLKEYGFSVFLAHRDIRPTTEWQNEILRVVNSTKVFITYITQSFKESDWCDQETGIAVAKGEKIIPINTPPHLPYGFIGKYQGIRLPNSEERNPMHIDTIGDKLSVSIVEALYEDPQTKDITKHKIFNQLKQIRSYHQTDLIFSVLEKVDLFSDEEKTAILNAYDTNNQISGAGSADSLVNRIRK